MGLRHVARTIDGGGTRELGECAAAAERWGLELHSGIATFPDQEVTFTGLLERAESALRENPASIHRTREPTVRATDSPAAAAPGLDA